jgi:ABC-type branched-subunit amino acid transport system substrate-binding protein
VTDRDIDFEPYETDIHRKRRRRRLVAIGAVVALVAAGAVWGVVTVLDTCGSLDSGVHEIDDDCVGITDGSYAFHPELADIESKIAAENARVRADERGYVSIALLDPLTPTDSSALPPDSVRNRLEGAYTALRRVNTERDAGDLNPQIQLLLANEGTTDGQWQDVRDRLDELSHAKQNPLVAVVGLGVSTARTQRHVEDLSERGIPMVGAVLTADTLEYDEVPGLIKTSPSNRHYVAALRAYLAEAGLSSAIMVRDSNSDAGFDLYTKTLEEDFESQMRGILKFETQQFTGKSAATNAPPSLFDNVQANICAAAGNRELAVLYAGREIDLGDFLDALQSRTCSETPLTILTAGVELGKVLHGKDLRGAKLTVLNAATVDPEGWSHHAPGTPEYFAKFRTAFVDKAHFSPDDLADGGAIMMHDAVFAAARAIRLAAPNGSASRVTPNAVRAQLLNINTAYSVHGASGTLRFSKKPSGNGTGIPRDKPIPVLEYPSPNSSVPSQQVGSLCYVADTPTNVHCGVPAP